MRTPDKIKSSLYLLKDETKDSLPTTKVRLLDKNGNEIKEDRAVKADTNKFFKKRQGKRIDDIKKQAVILREEKDVYQIKKA